MSSHSSVWSSLPTDPLKEVLSLLSLEEQWRLCGVSMELRSIIFKMVETWTSLDLSHLRWRLEDHHLEGMLKHCPNISKLNLQSCYRLTDNALDHIALYCGDRLVHLSLIECNKITPTGISKKLVPRCHQLTHLSAPSFEIFSSQLGGMDDDALSSIAEHCPNLTNLCIWNGMFTDKGIERLVNGCPHIEVLDIWNPKNVTYEGFSQIFEKYKDNLKEINLSNCNVSDENISEISMKCTKLEKLVLTRAANRRLFQGLDDLSRGVCNLTLLNLRKFHSLPATIVEQLAVHYPGLRELDIGGCKEVEDPTIQVIATHCTQLEVLSLWVLDISDTSVEVISKNCPHIKQLDLRSCRQLTDESGKWISEGVFASSLINLDLQDCENMTDLALCYLSKKCHNLEVLNIQTCYAMTDVGVVALISSCPKLMDINLSFCLDLTDVTLEAIGKYCQKLKFLLMPELSQITDSGIKHLQDLSSLIEVDLNKCTQVTIDGIKSLSKNKNLRILNLKFNQWITDDDVKEIAKMFSELEEIYLASTNITAESLHNLVSYCKGITYIAVNECSGVEGDLFDIMDLYPDVEFDE